MAVGTDTFQEGRKGSGKDFRGYKGGRDRLWSDQYGGGLMDRQIINPAVQDYMRATAMGQTPSAAQLLLQAGLGQQQAQAYGMAAGASGVGGALAMRQAQQAAATAGLQAQAQFGAMRADEMMRAQQMYAQTMLGQQQMNDQAALAREQLLQNYIAGGANVRQQELSREAAMYNPLVAFAGGVGSGAGETGVEAIFGPAKPKAA